jgi:hypothetical protein
LSNKLRVVGETTLGLNELGELWKESSTSLADAEGLIFGNTPMCEALRKSLNRFRCEIPKYSSKGILPIFLLVSDGEPTDGDPELIADQIRQLGVTLVGCYITSQNVVAPRTLYATPQVTWPSSARRMFEMSSQIPEDSPLNHYLLRQGWVIAPNAKAFIQANHSEILEELVGLALSPIESGYELLPKGQ